MWLGLVLVVVIVIALVVGLFAGGIFTIVLIPIAVIAGGSAFAYMLWSRATAESSGSTTDHGGGPDEPLPHATPGSSGHVLSTPEGLTDARRQAQ